MFSPMVDLAIKFQIIGLVLRNSSINGFQEHIQIFNVSSKQERRFLFNWMQSGKVISE